MMFRILTAGFLVVLLCMFGPPASGAGIEGWELRSAQLRDMTYGAGVYVAVGRNGFILRSIDGLNWSRVDAGVYDDLFTIVYGDALFVTTGDGVVLTSPDGLNWTEQNPSVTPYVYDLVYGEGIYVGLSSWGKVYTSPDGASWDEFDTGASQSQTAIAYGEGLFVLVGYGGMILTSDNGSSGWTSRVSPVSPTFWDIIHTGTEFVAVGTSGNVVSSGDGISWATTPSGFTQTMMAVGYGNGRFVSTGSNSSSDTGHVWTSPDGRVWTDHFSGYEEFMYDMEAIGSRYFITGGKIITSTNGTDWTAAHDATGWSIQSLAYGDDVYVAGFQFGTSLRSADGGTTWRAMTSPVDSDITGIAYNPALGLFTGVCSNGQVLSASPANDYWVTTSHALIAGLRDVTYDPGTGSQLLVGYSGTIATIDNAGVLSTVSPLTSSGLSGVAVAGSTYVAVGDNGTVITSLNSGATWQTVTSATGETLLDVEYGNGLWMAGGYFGALITSPDGVNWTDASGSFSHVYGITYGDGKFVAHGGSGTLMSSPDGLTWKEYYVTDSYLPAGVYAEGRFTIAGGDGVILQSLSGSGGGGGGGGGCSTAGALTGLPLLMDLFWIALLAGFLMVWRRKREI